MCLMASFEMKTKLFFLFLLIFSSCSFKSEKNYIVVDSFSQVVYETNDKEEAFEQADQLTLLGRVFSSKPQYFVIEADQSQCSIPFSSK